MLSGEVQSIQFLISVAVFGWPIFCCSQLLSAGGYQPLAAVQQAGCFQQLWTVAAVGGFGI